MLDAGFLIVGLVLLYFGAEWLVAGAAGLARAAGMRPLVVGLTVVAFGTSAPELVVSVSASLEQQGALALGNVIGSNIANLGLILGMTALIMPPRVDGQVLRREIPVLLAVTALVPLTLLDGTLERWESVALPRAPSATRPGWSSVRASVRSPKRPRSRSPPNKRPACPTI